MSPPWLMLSRRDHAFHGPRSRCQPEWTHAVCCEPLPEPVPQQLSARFGQRSDIGTSGPLPLQKRRPEVIE
jgi:hypothetical protein